MDLFVPGRHNIETQNVSVAQGTVHNVIMSVSVSAVYGMDVRLILHYFAVHIFINEVLCQQLYKSANLLLVIKYKINFFLYLGARRATGWTHITGKRFVSSPQGPDRPWGPPSLLHNGYRGLYPRGSSERGIKLTTYLHLLSR
jgi:hypothetical protein